MARKPSASSASPGGLEGDRAGMDAAVEFRQHDVHGEVGGGKAAVAAGPSLAPGGRDDGLEHRHTEAVEQRRLTGSAPLANAVQATNAAGFKRLRRLFDEGERSRLLEAGHEHRHRRDAALLERCGKAVDGCRVGTKKHRAIEQDRHHRTMRRGRGKCFRSRNDASSR